MTAHQLYLAGLRAGFQDESLGITEPEQGYPPDEPYLAGVRAGREAWRRCAGAAMVVDRDPIYLIVKARSERIVAGLSAPTPLTPKDVEQCRADSAACRAHFHKTLGIR